MDSAMYEMTKAKDLATTLVEGINVFAIMTVGEAKDFLLRESHDNIAICQLAEEYSKEMSKQMVSFWSQGE